MNHERNLLFGVLAFQKGLIDADQLAETCAEEAADTTVSMADRLVEHECLTLEQKTELELAVDKEVATHGGDPLATLAATLDGRSLDALREAPGLGSKFAAGLTVGHKPTGPVLIGSLGAPDPDDSESRERYTLTHLYAKGGMGQVWLAHDPALEREIALKELRPDQMDNAAVSSRFLSEARVTAQLEHPGIVPVYELGAGDVPYYTMRFIRGGTLSETARAYHKDRAAGTTNPVGLVKLLGAFVGVCNAIAYAHSRGFIHRDLKGQNVVLGDFGEVIVLDWGLAKRVEPSLARNVAGQGPTPTEIQPVLVGDETLPPDDASALTQASQGGEPGPRAEITMQGQVLGTPAYMAPEQAEGRQDQTSPRTDVYGLGAILYEILAGQPPFQAKTTSDLLRKVRAEAPTAPRQINPTVAPALEAVCLKALAKQPSDRYATAADLAQEVQRFLADEPVLAFPEPWPSRAARWARKHRTAVATAAGLLITATVALAVSTVLVARERTEARVQGLQARRAVNDMYVKVAENWLEDRLDPLQKEILEKALHYYEKFTSYAVSSPAVRLEHGQALQRMGEIHRKLGQLPEAEASFGKAIAMLEPLAAGNPSDQQPRQALALTMTRLGDLLFRDNQIDRSEALLLRAEEQLKPMAEGPGASIENQWLLARTLRSQAEVLRRKGNLAAARPVAIHACELLEQVLAARPQAPEARYDLAQANDFLGRVVRDLGESETYEKAYRRAYELLDSLITAFPTVPRYREAMSHTCNGLGQFERVAGRLDDCETHWRRELKEAERLVEDFADRPEYQRLLAGGCSNLGGILAEQDRFAEAEPVLRRGIALNTALLKTFPKDQEVAFDLGTCHYNLGYLQIGKGQAREALASIEQARLIEQTLANGASPMPRYRRMLAMALRYQGEALDALEQAGADQAYQASVEILEKLTTEFPTNVFYQIEYAQCLNKLAEKLAQSRRNDEAEAAYQHALAALNARPAADQSHDGRLEKAMTLSNLATFRQDAKRPGGEEALRQSIAIAAELASDATTAARDRQFLAIAQSNLGELLRDTGRAAEALPEFRASVAALKALVSASSTSVKDQFYLGYVSHQHGKALMKTGALTDARLAFTDAVTHQKEAVRLTAGGTRQYRAELVAELEDLADVNLSLGEYQAVIDAAADLARASVDVPRGDYDAARMLARCAIRLQADARLGQDRKDDLGRDCLGRTVVMLRQAVDLDEKLAAGIKADPVFKELLDRPSFRAMIESMVKLGSTR